MKLAWMLVVFILLAAPLPVHWASASTTHSITVDLDVVASPELAVVDPGDDLEWINDNHNRWLTVEASDGTDWCFEIPARVEGGNTCTRSVASLGLSGGLHTYGMLNEDGDQGTARICVTQPASISFTAAPATVTGDLVLEGTVSAARPVARVEARIGDGPWVRALGAEDWWVSLDSTLSTNGAHDVEIRAPLVDCQTVTASAPVTVDNAEFVDPQIVSLGEVYVPDEGTVTFVRVKNRGNVAVDVDVLLEESSGNGRWAALRTAHLEIDPGTSAYADVWRETSAGPLRRATIVSVHGYGSDGVALPDSEPIHSVALSPPNASSDFPMIVRNDTGWSTPPQVAAGEWLVVGWTGANNGLSWAPGHQACPTGKTFCYLQFSESGRYTLGRLSDHSQDQFTIDVGGSTAGPSIAITDPVDGATVAPQFTVTGTASGPAPLGEVSARAAGSSWNLTAGTSSWSLSHDRGSAYTGTTHQQFVTVVDRAYRTATAEATYVIDNPLKPDFAIDQLKATNAIQTAFFPEIYVRVVNQGTLSAAPTLHLEFFVDGQWEPLADRQMRSLAPGETAGWYYTWYGVGLVGEFPVRVLADLGDAFVELDEANNERSTTARLFLPIAGVRLAEP